jgi:multiple sugar transport system ATP-binding protein
MVFQNYALYPHMTVAENMGFNLKLAKKSPAEIEARVGEAARMLGLTPLLHRRGSQLSGGQRQRVAMGRAVVRNPMVFLFDEPLSNLDEKLRVQIRTEIKALHQKVKTTSIYVTHDQIEAMTLADHTVVMHGGRIEQQGHPLELYRRPANLFVAGFIGTPAMNFIEAVGGSDDRGGGRNACRWRHDPRRCRAARSGQACDARCSPRTSRCTGRRIPAVRLGHASWSRRER